MKDVCAVCDVCVVDGMIKEHVSIVDSLKKIWVDSGILCIFVARCAPVK